MATQRNIQRALYWIVGVLRKHKVLFQITGGLAASCYGSPRKFHDIDILISKASLQLILPNIKRRLVFSPAQYRDQHLDSFMAALKIYGVKIDLGTSCRIKNRRTGRWHQTPGLTQPTSWKRLWGLRIPLEPRTKLIKIKRILGRKKDMADIAAMRA